jgi:predicted PurR-regulated permease PerM
MAIELSQRQQNTVAAAITILSAVVIVVAFGTLFWLIGAFFSRFSNVFLPLAVAAVAALVFRPYFDFLCQKLKLGRGMALVVLFLSAIIPLVAFLWFFGALLVDQLSDLVSRLPEWWAAGAVWFKERAPRVVEFINENPYARQLRATITGQQGSIMSGLGAVGRGALSAGVGVISWVGVLLSWLVAPVYFAFILVTDTRVAMDLERFLPFLKADTRKDVAYLVNQFVEIVVAFFRGQLIIAFLQGVLFAIGFSVVGLTYGAVIGLVLGFLNIIPYLGSIVGLATALPLAFFQPEGGLQTVALVLVVFTIVQLIEGYLLTPRIMGNRTGLHPMVIILAVFFWGSALNGIMGMILAIPLTAFLVVFWRLAREKYFTELV